MNDFDKAKRLNINARINQINQAIKSLQSTISRLENAREMPGVSIDQFRVQVEKLIKEKVELTGALDIGDAVEKEVTEDTPASQPVATKTDSTQQRQAFEKPGKKHGPYDYDEVFNENIDGDLIMTFPDEVFKSTGWKEGDTLDFEVVHGNLHIRKRVNVNK
jgi:hypothetical protein